MHVCRYVDATHTMSSVALLRCSRTMPSRSNQWHSMLKVPCVARVTCQLGSMVRMTSFRMETLQGMARLWMV